LNLIPGTILFRSYKTAPCSMTPAYLPNFDLQTSKKQRILSKKNREFFNKLPCSDNQFIFLYK
jgi:hypothetical protein